MEWQQAFGIRKKIEQELDVLGCSLFSILPLTEEPRFLEFAAWLKEGRHGSMTYLENHQHCRQDPRLLLQGACTAIVFGWPYYQGDKNQHSNCGPMISQYARLPDYHKHLRKIGNSLAKFIAYAIDEDNLGFRVTVDSAPILERALAERSPKGFIGKNTCFIHPDNGSFYLLGVLLIDLKLPLDAETKKVDPTLRAPDGGCGSCKRCQVHCPTGALDEDYKIDARKCLSFWTIENRGMIPVEYWPYLKTYWYGCDICQNVCPYNRQSPQIDKQKVRLPRHIDLFSVATMDQRYYEQTFGGTPMVRAKKFGLQRNALVAMWASNDPKLSEAIATLKIQVGLNEVVAATIEAILKLQQGPA